jgi:hypothetical protein
MRATRARQRRSAPVLDCRSRPGRHRGRIGRQQGHDDLDIARIADLQQRRAGGDDLLALADQIDHDTADRRAYR